MPRITKLMLLNGTKIGEWTYTKPSVDMTTHIWDRARREVADWADCPLSRVGYIENDVGGEFFTVDDEEVAFLVTQNIQQPVDLRPFMQAAE